MIEQALYQHLQQQASLSPFLAKYADTMAIFNQKAPADTDPLWGAGPQYGRIVFAVDIQGDPERTMGGVLTVDILCKENKQHPEEIEPLVRQVIHGYFFSNGIFTTAAQWKDSAYFTEPTNQVRGCTVSFELLAFPILTTIDPDVVARLNAWTSELEGLHVINLDPLPATAWKPQSGESAVYWRLVTEAPANWIPDTFHTIWRTATLRGHIFSEDNATAAAVARTMVYKLYADKRLIKEGESPIMTNRRNTIDVGADPLRTGQVMIEATYGVIIYGKPFAPMNHIYTDGKEVSPDGN